MAMYTGFYRRLHNSAVREVRMMAAHCITDTRTNTAKNITRICAEYSSFSPVQTLFDLSTVHVNVSVRGGGWPWSV